MYNNVGRSSCKQHGRRTCSDRILCRWVRESADAAFMLFQTTIERSGCLILFDMEQCALQSPSQHLRQAERSEAVRHLAAKDCRQSTREQQQMGAEARSIARSGAESDKKVLLVAAGSRWSFERSFEQRNNGYNIKCRRWPLTRPTQRRSTAV